MATLDMIPAHEDPVHLLLIADSKAGKSTYAAQAAIDGFTLVYIDSDNGISALRNALKDKPEAMKRVNYFHTERPVDFLRGFLRSSTNVPFRWVPTMDKPWGKLMTGVEPDAKVWQFDITKMPASWVLAIDSWTSAAADALGIGSADQKAELLEGVNQSIYGDANVNLTYIANMLQKIPNHCIVQAHGTKYEVYEKPTGQTAGAMKQKDMILREVIDVPLSSSRGHGQILPGKFNHAGWMSVDRLGESWIDFTRSATRVGGGPPNKKAKVSELPFSKLATLHASGDGDGWFVETTHEVLKGGK